MKIAVTYENGSVFGHFGHTEQFKIYDVENGSVASAQIVPTNGSGHGALAGFLAEHGVEALICGGIGGGAQEALSQTGIRLYAGCAGNADERVAELLGGTLAFAEGATCDHHHEEGHHCGGHEHTCGHC
ncbi:NifB/NifX family molybdenum-iron cluster-binding protein [Oscillibacter sp.]|uniref:NifB/NifX family molybdenum-iron cluster-binding protein n=1 Tax=Oscillibacter sp. TaxID=1945593 RepID=UPI00261C9BA4|nr:NifB/NifX family molybdenum-iron cluster-binding protein [Oscillibacter sp.]MDD3346945.1 NifB/NifX family molybdenum-iron cluster-binding protein [Oscillibacter sp.]